MGGCYERGWVGVTDESRGRMDKGSHENGGAKETEGDEERNGGRIMGLVYSQ